MKNLGFRKIKPILKRFSEYVVQKGDTNYMWRGFSHRLCVRRFVMYSTFVIEYSHLSVLRMSFMVHRRGLITVDFIIIKI